MSLAFLSPGPGAVGAMAPAQRALGARFGTRDGWEVVTGYGDEAAEAAALRQAVGVIDVSHLTKLELHGGAPGAVMGTAQRIADAWLCPVTPQRRLLIGQAAAVAAAAPEDGGRLDVTAGYAALVLAGPAAQETLARFCALDLRPAVSPPGAFRPGSVARTPAFVLCEAPERFLILLGAAYGLYMWEVVTDAAGRLGGRPTGLDALGGLADA